MPCYVLPFELFVRKPQAVCERHVKRHASRLRTHTWVSVLAQPSRCQSQQLDEVIWPEVGCSREVTQLCRNEGGKVRLGRA